MVLQGTSLTLMGLFELDLKTGCTKMTEMTHLLTGGLYEATNRMQERINQWTDLSVFSFTSGVLLMMMGGYIHLKRIRNRRLERKRA